MTKRIAFLSFGLLALVVAASVSLGNAALASDGTASAPDAALYFVAPTDGATVSSPVTVVFGLRGMGVAPAGIEKAKTGHHHLLIDTPHGALPPLDESIPADEHHRHFGGGQTEVTIDLAPGTHTLRLLLGDHNHIPHEPPVMSAPITITVK